MQFHARTVVFHYSSRKSCCLWKEESDNVASKDIMCKYSIRLMSFIIKLGRRGQGEGKPPSFGRYILNKYTICLNNQGSFVLIGQHGLFLGVGDMRFITLLRFITVYWGTDIIWETFHHSD